MKVIDPSIVIERFPGSIIYRVLERIGRTCYKSESLITKYSAESFIQRIIESGHESILEHETITVRIVCDRGVSHELVRHRLCSFTQESTRYCNYSNGRHGNEITVIRPFFFDENSPAYATWYAAMKNAEEAYLELVKMGATAQEARSVLPNSLKTEIVITANIREWRHIFKLRCAKAAHPQMQQIMLPLFKILHGELSCLFDDLAIMYKDDIDALEES